MVDFLSHLQCGFFLDGKIQGEFSVPSRLAFHLHAALILLHDAVADAEAKTHALSDILGGEERVENLVEMLGFDAAAIVADNEAAASILYPPGDRDRRGFAKVKGPFLERVERVLEHVHNDLDELVPIGPDDLF